MRFLIDTHLPIRLAIYLRQRGHDCVHVLDAGLDEADDLELWEISVREQRIVVSKDVDFVFLANRPGDTGRLVWIRIGNCRNAALINAFDRTHDTLEECFESGQRIVEVR